METTSTEKKLSVEDWKTLIDKVSISCCRSVFYSGNLCLPKSKILLLTIHEVFAKLKVLNLVAKCNGFQFHTIKKKLDNNLLKLSHQALRVGGLFICVKLDKVWLRGFTDDEYKNRLFLIRRKRIEASVIKSTDSYVEVGEKVIRAHRRRLKKEQEKKIRGDS